MTAGAGVYAFDASAAEHDRLVRSSRRLAENVRDAARRGGVRAGDRVVEFGCGPAGALLVFADLVGPSGRVVGVDSSAAALEQAAALIAQEGVANISVVCADLTSLSPGTLEGGPFDVAYCRRFLVWQPDPEQALCRMSAHLRPGGRLIIQEISTKPGFPSFDPPVPAAERLVALSHQFLARVLPRSSVVSRLPQACQAAGLRVLSHRGFTDTSAPIDQLREMQAVIGAARRAAVELGMATDAELDQMIADLEAATNVTFESHFGDLYAEVIAARPYGPSVATSP